MYGWVAKEKYVLTEARIQYTYQLEEGR